MIELSRDEVIYRLLKVLVDELCYQNPGTWMESDARSLLWHLEPPAAPSLSPEKE